MTNGSRIFGAEIFDLVQPFHEHLPFFIGRLLQTVRWHVVCLHPGGRFLPLLAEGSMTWSIQGRSEAEAGLRRSTVLVTLQAIRFDKRSDTFTKELLSVGFLRSQRLVIRGLSRASARGSVHKTPRTITAIAPRRKRAVCHCHSKTHPTPIFVPFIALCWSNIWQRSRLLVAEVVRV